MQIPFYIAGALLLIFGRKLFWMFVAIIGFLIGITFAPELLPDQPEAVILVVASIFGLLGALFSILLQKFAVGVSGFIAGGYITFYILQTIVVNVGQYQWVAIVAGAFLGAVLAASLVDWGLILLTSISGAVLIADNLSMKMPLLGAVLLVLIIIGIIAQVRIKIHE